MYYDIYYTVHALNVFSQDDGLCVTNTTFLQLMKDYFCINGYMRRSSTQQSEIVA